MNEETKDRYEEVEIFGIPMLYSEERISGEMGLYRYQLRGSDDDPGTPVSVESHVMVNYAGTLLSSHELTIPGYLPLDEELNFTGEQLTIEEYRERTAEVSMQPEADDLPLYRHDAAYALEHGERDLYLESRRENIACRQAIEATIQDNFDGMHLNADSAKSVIAQFGPERVEYVLAATVQQLDWDGRFSRDNKEWAKGISIDGSRSGRDYIVSSHPAVLNGFINQARQEIRELEQQKGFIDHYYVDREPHGGNPVTIQTFPDMESAFNAYAQIPNDQNKELGMESTEKPPSRMPLIQCENGLDKLYDIEFASLSGKWVNAEVTEAENRAQLFLDSHKEPAAWQLENSGGYLAIQPIEAGYDYTFYDQDFQITAGGVYEDRNISMEAVRTLLLEDFGMPPEKCRAIHYPALMSEANTAEHAAMQQDLQDEKDRGKSALEKKASVVEKLKQPTKAKTKAFSRERSTWEAEL